MAHDLPAHTTFAAPPELASERLTLRALSLADVPDIREISVYDGVAATTDDEAREMLQRIEADMARGASLHWGICLTGSGEVVGTCGFYRGFDNGVGEIGYVVREEFRRRRIASEAVRLTVDFGLNEMGLRAVVAYTSAQNRASQALLARVGFRRVPVAGSGLAYMLP